MHLEARDQHLGVIPQETSSFFWGPDLFVLELTRYASLIGQWAPRIYLFLSYQSRMEGFATVPGLFMYFLKIASGPQAFRANIFLHNLPQLKIIQFLLDNKDNICVSFLYYSYIHTLYLSDSMCIPNKPSFQAINER